jgi:hypothetical protein
MSESQRQGARDVVQAERLPSMGEALGSSPAPPKQTTAKRKRPKVLEFIKHVYTGVLFRQRRFLW